MARYRKIDPRIWNDENFRKLSRDEKLICIYCFTAQSNRVGIFSFSPARAAEDLDTYTHTYAKGFSNVLGYLSWRWDSDARVLFLPTWWKYNQPENPKHLIGCLSDLDELPSTPLISNFYSNTKYLTGSLLDTFLKRIPIPIPIGMPKGMPYQELELELELKQEQKKNTYAAVPLMLGEFANVKISLENQQKLIDRFGETQALEKIEDLSRYLASNGRKKYSNHYATILNWESLAKKKTKTYAERESEAQAKQRRTREASERILARMDAKTGGGVPAGSQRRDPGDVSGEPE